MAYKTHFRTHHCGALRICHKNEQVKLCGWVGKIRDQGPLYWLDLRDRYGITQIVLEKGKVNGKLFSIARRLYSEDILYIEGTVLERRNKNNKIPTGEVEVRPVQMRILNPSERPPFDMDERIDSREDLRMRYRYLDLRRAKMQRNLLLRSRIAKEARSFLDQQGFMEIETPLLIKSTPEGARDFIVPSRIHQKHYYALPQSPQLLKQIAMVAGMDRIYQIAKCFRDEDLRKDRQPEFTQLDCEMSFVDEEDILVLFEELVQYIFYKVIQVELPTFPRMTYDEAIGKYGTDAPDLRWDMPLIEATNLVKGYGFAPFDRADHVMGMKVPGGAKHTLRTLKDWGNWLKTTHLEVVGPVHVAYTASSAPRSSVSKFYGTNTLQEWGKKTQMHLGDLLLLVGGSKQSVRSALIDLRNHIVEQKQVVAQKTYAPVWITDFPLFVSGETQNTYQSVHHPFTSPKTSDVESLGKDPLKVRSRTYDLVMNGMEIGGGSIRIHKADVQKQVLNLLGLDDLTINDRFGFLLEALSYGAPPHGGIALGFDRLCLLLGGGHSIRDYIAFPKNNQGRDTMIGAPALL